MQIHGTDTGAGPLAVLTHPRRALCMSHLSQEALATGSEDGFVRIWDQRRPHEPSLTLSKAHKSRVKGVAPLQAGLDTAEAHLLASASSDGTVKLWDLRMLRKDSSEGGVPYTFKPSELSGLSQKFWVFGIERLDFTH